MSHGWRGEKRDEEAVVFCVFVVVVAVVVDIVVVLFSHFSLISFEMSI